MLNLIYTVILVGSFYSNISLAHGSLELIECHNDDNSIIFRGEAINKKNDFKFVLLKNNKEVWADKKIRLKLADSVEGTKVMENITIKSKDGDEAKIKVWEVYAREIRNGWGEINIKKPKLKIKLTCYAVY